MAATTLTKDPNAKLDYGRTWADWLEPIGDTIDTSTWIVEPAGELVETSSSKTDLTATVWLEGGVAGKSYKVTNRIVTVGGRTDDRTFTVAVRDR